MENPSIPNGISPEALQDLLNGLQDAEDSPLYDGMTAKQVRELALKHLNEIGAANKTALPSKLLVMMLINELAIYLHKMGVRAQEGERNETAAAFFSEVGQLQLAYSAIKNIRFHQHDFTMPKD